MAKSKVQEANTTTPVEEKTPAAPRSIVIDSSTPVESVLDFDSKGTILQFDSKEAFIELDEINVRSLSRDNAARYGYAKEFHAAWLQQKADGLDEVLKVDLQLTGRPEQKLDFKLPKGLEGRWTRPELVRDRMAKGWRIADDSAETFIGRTGSVHKIGFGGQTELVLMVKDAKEVAKARAEKASENNARAGFKQKAVTGEMAQAGIREFDPFDDDAKRKREGRSRAWRETGSAGEESPSGEE